MACNGVKMGLCHLFVQPKRSRFTFGKTHFSAICNQIFVPKQPGTQDLHPDTHRGPGYNSQWPLRFTTYIRAPKQEKLEIRGRGHSKAP